MEATLLLKYVNILELEKSTIDYSLFGLFLLMLIIHTDVAILIGPCMSDNLKKLIGFS